MSIATAIEAAQQKVANAYSAVSNKGGSLPATQNLSNLPTAINSIPTGGPSPVIDSLTINPTTSQQTITAPTGTDGYSPITVNAVTSSIDANITAGNIKNGVSILGVTGNYDGEDSTKYNVSIDGLLGGPTSGELTIPSEIVNLNTGNDVTKIGEYALACLFYEKENIASITMPEVTEIKDYGLYQMCYCYIPLSGIYMRGILTSISFPKLTTIGNYGMYSAFYSTALTGNQLDFSKVTSVGQASFQTAFLYASNLTGTADFSSLQSISFNGVFSQAFFSTGISAVDFSNLETITGNSVFTSAFGNCPNINSVNFNKLKTITGASAFGSCFSNCTSLTSLSFPSLTSTFNIPSSGTTYTNQFNNMLNGVTGCTVHFPSNLQSVIGSWADVTAGFRGTNTTVLFDLPATI